jgi:hypothetical protein
VLISLSKFVFPSFLMLLALSKNHWNIDPDEVHYGDVGDLRRVLQILKEI